MSFRVVRLVLLLFLQLFKFDKECSTVGPAGLPESATTHRYPVSDGHVPARYAGSVILTSENRAYSLVAQNHPVLADAATGFRTT